MTNHEDSSLAAIDLDERTGANAVASLVMRGDLSGLGPEDRARKTRRNPHGIAEMEHGDNFVAFGGFTPAFLLVDPYGGKGAPPPTTEEPIESSDSQSGAEN